MVSKSKIKNEVKKAFRLPGNAAVMSMMAVILVCAAPALVSIIDDSVNQEYDTPLVPNYMDSVLIYPNNTRIQGEVVASSDLGVSIIREDNVISILSDTPGYSGVLTIFFMDKAVISDTTKIVIGSSSEYSSISIDAGDHDVHGVYDPETQEYTFTLSSIDRHYIMSTDSDFVSINVTNTVASGKTYSAVETISVEVYGSVMIPYAEIIIGATGALLLICALLATPWVSTSGLTIRRR